MTTHQIASEFSQEFDDDVTSVSLSPVPLKVRRSGIRRALVAIIAVQVVLWFWACSQLTYFQDDWPISYTALDTPLFSRDWLLLDNNGYVAPVSAAIVWLTVHAAPFNYPFALTVAVALGLILDWSAWTCLRAYLGRRPVTVVWFAVFALSPLWIAVVGWWTVATGVIPASIAMAWMVTGVKRFSIDRRQRHLVAVAAWFGVALLCTPKSALLGVFLAVFVPAVLLEGRLRVRTSIFLRRWYVLWIGMAVVGVVWLVGYVSLATQRSTSLSTGSTLWILIRESLLGTFIPSLFGGPWSAGPGPIPYFGQLSFWAVIVLLEVLVLIVIALRRWNNGPWLPLVPLGVMVAGNLVLLGWAAIGVFGPDITRQGRYWADVLLPAVLCLALVATPCRGASAAAATSVHLRWRSIARRVTPVACIVAVIAFANSAFVTTNQVGEAMRTGGAREFLSNAISGLQTHPSVVILDRGMPSQIVNLYLFPKYGQTSQALQYWVTNQKFDQPTKKFFMFDDTGVLGPAKLQPAATSIPGPNGGCGYFASATPVSVSFPSAIFKWRWVVQLNYLANSSFVATVKAGGATALVPVTKGLNQVQFVLVAGFSSLSISTPSADNGMCVDFAAVGNLAPE